MFYGNHPNSSLLATRVAELIYSSSTSCASFEFKSYTQKKYILACLKFLIQFKVNSISKQIEAFANKLNLPSSATKQSCSEIISQLFYFIKHV